MMAKSTTKSRAKKPDQVTITYDLFDLPTSQHKAGLAGLLLQIDYMLGRRPMLLAPRILERTPTSATIEFTEETVQSLMDNLYDAAMVRKPVKAKWPNTTPLAEDFVEETDEHGKTKRVKVFIYEVCEPKGHFLDQHFGQQNAIWHRLWRDMVWNIPRGNPQSRQPFEQRANDQPCREGATSWGDLVRVAGAKEKNSYYTTDVAGSLWLGAQATNAEGIPFEGRAEQNLLLHFWPLTSLVYVPRVVTVDGTCDFVGYVLAIPDVADLGQFVAKYPVMLEGLTNHPVGYRPAEAVIDLPAESALSFFEHLALLAADKAGNADVESAIGAVDYLHLDKRGNNIKTMAAGRIARRPHLLEDYQAIVGRPGERPPYGNPLFRRGLMLAILEERPWFQPFGSLLSQWPHTFFLRTNAPPKMSWFWTDAQRKFQEVIADMPTDPCHPAPDSNDNRLASLVFRLVRNYLSVKATEKSKVDLDKYRSDGAIQWDNVPKEYKEARADVAATLFLEYRSRHDQAFVDQFVARLGAVKQFLNEEDYLVVSHALVAQCEHVKTLTLLALSANS